MDTMITELTGLVSGAFSACGYDGELGRVIVSNRPDLCDYQCDGALKGAKLHRKAPLAIAQDVAARLGDHSVFSEVSVVPPGFINLRLSQSGILDYVNGMIRGENAGIFQVETGETIVIDYGGPNIAKPLHIGHLRAAIIGEALKRLMRLLGYHVIGDIHLGDWGLQIGLVMAELSERFPDYSCFAGSWQEGDELPPITADSLNEIYPFASKKSKEDEPFSEKAHRFTFELQKRTPGFLALWKKIWETSVADLKGSYEKLNVDFDLWYGESDADPYIEQVVRILEEKELLEDSSGAKIVTVLDEADRRPVPPAIIIKSDGAVNYETTDVATLLQRQKDFAPEKIWYVVDKRQELHFLQVFRVAKKAGIIPEDTELLHLGFGTMNGTDGKPYKTRDGGIMRLSDMIETVTNAAAEKIRTSTYVEEGDTQDIALKIGVAAIKFGDLINHRTKDYVFDIDRFLSFEGKTGSYILYMVARINSLLKKIDFQEEESGLTGVYTPEERELLLRVIGTGDVFWTAAREKAPNYICENAYQIASAFSQFYHANRIVDEADPVRKKSWVNICKFVRSLLELHLEVLGIDTVEFM